MKVTIIGGPLNGQTREIPDGAASWLDIEHAEVYFVRAVGWAVAGEDGNAVELWELRVAVWPGFMTEGPATESFKVSNTVTQLAMTDFMRRNADAKPIGAAPDDPSALFGVDGRPIGGGVPE